MTFADKKVKVIDAHTHIGTYGVWSCNIESLIKMMDEHGISQALVSDMDANELGAITADNAIKQIAPYGDRLKLLLWVHPGIPGDFELAGQMLQKYDKQIVGLKLHPMSSHISPDDPRCDGYATLCERYRIPMEVHTQNVDYSDTQAVERLAIRHPRADFIAIHMDHRGDHSAALASIRGCGNLYGDTTWVDVQTVLQAIAICGADKILYGTDAPVLDYCYRSLDEIRSEVSKRYGTETLNMILNKNCSRLFRL